MKCAELVNTHFAKVIPDKKDAIILDMGCGTGLVG